MSEDDAMYKMPPTDTSPFSLMLWWQFGFFLLMLYEWTANSSEGDSLLFGAIFVLIGLLLLLRVKNGVLGAMGVLAAIPVVIGLMDGESLPNIMMFIFWMVVFMGGMAIMLPATGFREYGLEISDGTRKWVVILVVSLVCAMFGAGENYDLASSGEYNDDSDSMYNEAKDNGTLYDKEKGQWIQPCSDRSFCYEAGDMNVNLAWAGFAVAVIGLLIFLATAAGGLAIGPLRPFHGVAIAVLSAWLTAYNLSDFVGRNLPVELAWALTISGLMILPVYNLFDNDTAEV